MHDTGYVRPDHRCLYETAAGQHGYVTASDARACGFSADLLGHHAASGRLRRVSQGVYRLRHFPSGPADDAAEAWIRTGKVGVVSHESALELLDLGDIIPRTVHLTVPREQRWRRAVPGVTLHTTTRPFAAADLTEREGLPVTAPLRTILDAAASGTPPDQLGRAVRDAIARGWMEAGNLVDRARAEGGAVALLILRAVEEAGA